MESVRTESQMTLEKTLGHVGQLGHMGHAGHMGQLGQRSSKDWRFVMPGNGVTLMFAGITDFSYIVLFFFNNLGTEGKNGRNSNENGELRVPLGVWDSGGTKKSWDSGAYCGRFLQLMTAVGHQ